jgi:hypothetical protein
VKFIIVICALACLIGGRLEARECARCRLAAGWGLASAPSTAVNPGQMVTISGEIISVEDVEPDQGLISGVYLLLAVGDEQVPIRVSSKEFLVKSGVQFEPFDQVQVTGSKVDVNGKVGLIATEIKHSKGTLDLRHAFN